MGATDDHQMEHPRIGRIARALRHRLSLRQRDVAARAGTSQSMVSLVERGRLDEVSLPTTRRILRSLEADIVLVVRWRGGDVDRLLDRAHAGLGERVTHLSTENGWEVMPEVTFSEFGERGSIDILAWHPASRVLLVIELKSELTSIEETLRRHDVKVRLAPKIAQERWGWRPLTVARLLVFRDSRTARHHVGLHPALFASLYPDRNVAIRAFLRNPSSGPPGRPVGGILFLSEIDPASGMRAPGPRKRIRKRNDAASERGRKLPGA